MVKRVLVTSAIEDTWTQDNPVVFLGEWCKRKSRESEWQSLESITMPYHWDDRKKLKKDYFYIQNIYEDLLQETSIHLNSIHKVNYSERYWRILIGPWLGYFIQVIFDRWTMLEIALKSYNIDFCKVLITDDVELVPNDMSHFTNMFVNDDWNEAVYAQLLLKYYGRRIDIHRVIKKTSSESFKESYAKIFEKKLKKFINSSLDNLYGYFSKSNECLFKSTYLPWQVNFKIQRLLGQWPKFWGPVSAPISSADFSWRNWNLKKDKDKDSFYNILKDLIPKHIPTSYLEGYLDLNNKIQGLNWPKNPKVIFTSNAYSHDDIFKAWAALKTDRGFPLIIGQHGGNFGMTPYSFYEQHQIEIADFFISWGWTIKNNTKIIPIGNFMSSSNIVSYDRKGSALMVEMTVPRYSYHIYSIPIASQWLYYFQDQCKFYDTLTEDLKSQLNLRLYRSDYGWDQELLWNDKFPNINIDNGSQNIRKLINKSRLYISTYNATTYLETLNWNIPTIIFWNENFWEINDDVKPYFDLLRSVGIFHDTPESAAHKMIEIWDDIDDWWKNENLQSAREKFCKRFSKIPDSLEQDLHDFIVETCS